MPSSIDTARRSPVTAFPAGPSRRLTASCLATRAWAEDHPLGAHVQVGWRFVRRAWGHGYATEATLVALDDAFGRAGLKEILAYTAADNARSQAVMGRLGLTRDPSRDFTMDNGWRGMVWVARPA